MCIYAIIRRIEIISKKKKTSTFVILTRGQARALPVILSARTIEEGCKNAGISRQTGIPYPVGGRTE
jgi:hypothetical protein